MPGWLADGMAAGGWLIALTYLRLQAAFLILPGIGTSLLPARVKVGLAMALAPMLSQVAGAARPPTDMADAVAQALPQLAIGFAIGGLVRLMAMALDVAAAAMAATASLSQIVGGANEAAPHPVGNLLYLGGLAVLFSLGFPMMLVDLMRDGFAFWPIGALPAGDRFVAEAIAVVARSFALAMMLAAPFILGGFLYQALSGVISRVMPTLPIMLIGAPGAILLALAAMVVLAPLLVGLWADAVVSLTLPGGP